MDHRLIQDATLVDQYGRTCQGFTRAVRSVRGRWDAATPCTAWDASALVDHVVGFHDVVLCLLRPGEPRSARPGGDPARRWTVAAAELREVLCRPGVLDHRRGRVLGPLTTDLLVHTWDLARAVDDPFELDPRLCEAAYRRVLAGWDHLVTSGAFAPALPVPDDAAIADKLVALLGRDPHWRRRP